ncbi:MAG: PIG-L family deacetylase [Acidimicrobiia bacterium]|nr:PIG-L family deacetylase [Acidimicrobiia bacterium]
MRRVAVGDDPHAPLRILCLGAHSDDIEIGAGGTILRLLEERPGSTVRWVVFSADDQREAEARASAAAFLSDAASTDVAVHRFAENHFPDAWAAIKREVAQLGQEAPPDLVLTHRRDDLHQDHRILGELAWNTFRDHLLLEYEIPKYEGDLGHPNLFVPLSATTATRKVELLMAHFGTQRHRGWFRPQTFDGLMALRAVECNAPEGAAEAFHARKLTM